MERRRVATGVLAMAALAAGAWLLLRDPDAGSRGDEMPARSSDDDDRPAGLSSEALAASSPLAARPRGKPDALATNRPALAADAPKPSTSPRASVDPRAIRGVVVDEGGKPMKDERVFLVELADSVEEEEREQLATLDFTQSDDRGRFEVSPSGESAVAVRISAAGREPFLRTVAPGQFVVARLGPGGRIRGRVVAADTRVPIADARLALARPRRGTGDGAFVESADESLGYTDAEGGFAAEARVGSARLSAYALGYSSQYVMVEVRADAEAETAVELRPMGRATLHGVVRVDGVPAANAFVSCASPRFSRGARLPAWAGTRSDAEGRYRLADVPLFQKVWVDAGPERRGFVWLGEHDDRVTDWPLDLDAPRTTATEGVVTQDGRPLAGVQFTMTCHVHGSSRSTSDAEGRFRLTLPCPESRAHLEARTPDGLLFAIPGDQSGSRVDSEPPMAVVVPPSGRVRGLVTDRAERPVPFARVTSGVSVARADGAGRFEIAVRAKPNVRLRAEAAGYSSQQTSPFAVEAGSVVDRSVRLSPGGSIFGRVVDERSQPIEGAVVRVLGGGGIRAETVARTQAEGLFEAGDVTGDSFRVEVTASGFVTRSVDGVEPDSVLPDVVLQRAGESPAPSK